MTDPFEKRRLVMRRSIALGHCVCDPRQACPCDEFRNDGVCHCAGERRASQEDASRPVRLTEHVRNPGCASKVSKAVLRRALQGLPELDDPRVLVGASCGDDAGVMDLGGPENAILTVDVFSPVVDDPYLFGQIAAANSLSDVYAMGGTAQAALSIIGFPVDRLPLEAMREILRGGADKMKEAGVPVIGGHSINDEEPKCGFAVLGACPRGGFIRNAGAVPGDRMVLTKPLGSGIVAFARQIGRAGEDAMAAVARSMAALNRIAGEGMVAHGAHAGTDVTGFSLMGHLAEIVKNSGVEAEIDFPSLPLFAPVRELADQEVLPGAVERNRESVDESLLDLGDLSVGERGILFGPETSGGILAFLPPDRADAFVRELRDKGVKASVIGRVTRAFAGGRIRVVPGNRESKEVAMTKTTDGPSKADEGCCSGGAGPSDLLPPAAGAEAFKSYLAAVNAPGAIDAKHKKLMNVALAVAFKCEPCVRIHARAARGAGAGEGEIAEAAALGIAFGGASAAMAYTKARGITVD